MHELTDDMIKTLNAEAHALRTQKEEVVNAVGMAGYTFDEFEDSLACLCEIDVERLVEVGFDTWVAEEEQNVADHLGINIELVRSWRENMMWLPEPNGEW